MSEVYRAQDLVLGRAVAIKALSPQLEDEEFLAAFKKEAAATANLQSPHIVNVYDWVVDGDSCYIVMELIEGETLRELLDSHGCLSECEVLGIGSQVAEALSAAHRMGIVHSDIKPQNIMIQSDGIVKVMDFGIAYVEGAPKGFSSGTTAGTIRYMSPEQFRGDKLTPASDVYSLGVVLYEAACGCLPSDGQGFGKACGDIAGELSLSFERHGASKEIAVGLKQILSKALQRDTAHRYPSATEMKSDLEACLRESNSSVRALVSSHFRKVELEESSPLDPRQTLGSPSDCCDETQVIATRSSGGIEELSSDKALFGLSKVADSTVVMPAHAEGSPLKGSAKQRIMAAPALSSEKVKWKKSAVIAVSALLIFFAGIGVAFAFGGAVNRGIGSSQELETASSEVAPEDDGLVDVWVVDKKYQSVSSASYDAFKLVTEYSYDDDGRLLETKDYTNFSSTDLPRENNFSKGSFSYDDRSRIVDVRYAYSQYGWQYGGYESIEYDESGRVSRIARSILSQGDGSESYSYEYDSSGNISSVEVSVFDHSGFEGLSEEYSSTLIFSYLDDQVLEKTASIGSAVTAVGLSQEFSDIPNGILCYKVAYKGIDFGRVTLRYDTNGNLASVVSDSQYLPRITEYEYKKIKVDRSCYVPSIYSNPLGLDELYQPCLSDAQISRILSSQGINAAGKSPVIHYDVDTVFDAADFSDSYMLPNSDSLYYTESELSSLSDWDLYIARNEIFARRGRMFKNQDLADYFSAKNWYHPKYSPEEFDAMPSLLNDHELKNAETIRRVEEERGSEYL